MSKKKNRSNKSWHSRQNKDPYVIKSREQGYRSRAAYKLLEINQKDHILKSGMNIIDLGSAPGGWSQVASEIVGEQGNVIALDILDMQPINNVYFIQGDFTTDEVFNKLLDYLDQNKIINKVDVVISDMAPNLTGIVTADQANSIYLVKLAYDLACKVLKPGGVFLAKAFQGANFDSLSTEIKQSFSKLLIRKPKSSRSESKEVYILAIGYEGL